MMTQQIDWVTPSVLPHMAGSKRLSAKPRLQAVLDEIAPYKPSEFFQKRLGRAAFDCPSLARMMELI